MNIAAPLCGGRRRTPSASIEALFWRRHAGRPLALLVLLHLVLVVGDGDQLVAGWLYAMQGGQWRLRHALVTETVLHAGGRFLQWMLWLAVLLLWIYSLRRTADATLRRALRDLLLATLLSALLVVWLKSSTGIDCPWDLRRFGGERPLIGWWQSRPAEWPHAACFPAAHAAGGYAWLATYFFLLRVSPAYRHAGLLLGLGLGLLFGIGQQLRGAHFASHDLWSAAICWFSSLAIYRVSDLPRPAWIPLRKAVGWLRERLWTHGSRPQLSQETLAWSVAAYFALACNQPFFTAVAAAGAFDDRHGILLRLCLLLAITSITALLVAPLLFRRGAKLILTVLLLLTALATHFMQHYGVYLDTHMIENVLHTDGKESFELLTPGLLVSLLLRGVVPALLLCRVRIVDRPWRRAVTSRLVCLLLALAVAGIAIGSQFREIAALMRNQTALRHLVTPANYLVSLLRVIGREAREEPPRAVVGADAHRVGRSAQTRPRLLVLVIGETVRAQNWGLNGYARQTTPQLARMPVVNFSNVRACGSSTEVSLPCMFSSFGRQHYDEQRIRHSDSLLHLLSRAGVASLWRDNQTGCKGVCAGLPFESFEHGGPGDACDAHGCLDQAMLDDLETVIRRRAGDQIIVLHQLGNHGPAYFLRYPPQFARFQPACASSDLGQCSPESIVNAYDNALGYTDYLLAEAIELLGRDTEHDSALIYVSDHGESLGENGLYLHGVPYAIAPDTQTQVPMVVWTSDRLARQLGLDRGCLARRGTLPLSHDNLFHSVLGLMQVQTSVYRPDLDLFAGCVANDLAMLDRGQGVAQSAP